MNDVELVAALLMKHGFSTGHADTMAEVLEELDRQLTELRSWQEKAFHAHPNLDLDIEALGNEA